MALGLELGAAVDAPVLIDRVDRDHPGLVQQYRGERYAIYASAHSTVYRSC